MLTIHSTLRDSKTLSVEQGNELININLVTHTKMRINAEMQLQNPKQMENEGQ